MGQHIDARAMVSPGAQVGDNVVIGPYAVIGDHVRIADSCVIDSFAQVLGYTEIGEGCHIFPYAVVGNIPQDLKYTGEKSFLIELNENGDEIKRIDVKANPQETMKYFQYMRQL